MKQRPKSLSLPKPIAAYFIADEVDAEAVSQCFTEGAVVKDEGHAHKGRAAINEWKKNASAKYQYTCEPFKCEEKDGRTIVPCHVIGNFPGSPADLRFLFKIDGDKIESLEIIP